MAKSKVIISGFIVFRSQDDLEKIKPLLLARYNKVIEQSDVCSFNRELDYEGDLALLQQTEKELIWDLLERNDIEPIGYPMVNVGEVRE